MEEMTRKRFGLIGRGLSHSLSPEIHAFFGLRGYELFDLPDEKSLDAFLERKDIAGFNITMPYKPNMLSYAKELSEEASSLGAANTMVRREDGSYYGTNTDISGFLWLLDRKGISVEGKRCLLLGNGATTDTVAYCLTKRGAALIRRVSRTAEGENLLSYEELSKAADTEILVNTTPVGMYPKPLQSLVSLDEFPHLEAVIDVIYRPLRTKLLQDAEDKGLLTSDGLPMLVEQARAASALFQKRSIPLTKSEEGLSMLREQFMNIVLIGMPGCGKTRTGRKLSKAMKRPFVDMDDYFTEKYGLTPSECIQEKGEPEFRRMETECLSEVCSKRGLIISTGGGVVTRPENRELMRQNGRVYWIQRRLMGLSTRNRPLSREKGVERLYLERKDFYQSMSDTVIWNRKGFSTAEDIKEDFYAYLGIKRTKPQYAGHKRAGGLRKGQLHRSHKKSGRNGKTSQYRGRNSSNKS